jgi:acetyl-CoA carboxylase biotin carboxyl carrier protein
MNIDEIRELMLLLDKSSIAELELHKDDAKLILRKANGEKESTSTRVAAGTAAPAAVVNESELAEAVSEKTVEVIAPMVGTFYAAPSPDSAPYVQVGDHVKPGQVLCIVEAMKLMNEIKSETSGTIIDILVKNAEVVEYGQVMFLIEED